MKGHILFQGVILIINTLINILKTFKHLIDNNHQVIFKQSWHKQSQRRFKISRYSSFDFNFIHCTGIIIDCFILCTLRNFYQMTIVAPGFYSIYLIAGKLSRLKQNSIYGIVAYIVFVGKRFQEIVLERGCCASM